MRCHHQWIKYRHRPFCVLCKSSWRRFSFQRTFGTSIASLLLASLLTLTFPTSSDQQEAEDLVHTKMIVAAARYVSVSQAIEYTDYMIQAAQRYGISPILLLSLNITESELNHQAKSHLGYRGISQIPENLPVGKAIMRGAQILRDKMSVADSTEEAIGAYKGFGFITNTHTRKVMRLKREIETL